MKRERPAGLLIASGSALRYDRRGDGARCLSYPAHRAHYAAGHKAMGLYAMWALRDKLARIGAPQLLRDDAKRRLRLEDLLGFRRNPITQTPLFRRLGVKALDGHPTPATPFVRLATGASGVGIVSSIGLAFGARDRYGENAPCVHVVEGEGGLTPGRVSEALAAAGTSGLGNVILHLDWNQGSIDSEHVCRDGHIPGDYVQWDPRELFYLHDWNVADVPTASAFNKWLPLSGTRSRSLAASRLRSSIAPSRAGATGSRAGPVTAPVTGSAPKATCY